MLRIALTGNIASGKSTVAALLRSWGVLVVDADALVREVQRPGSPVLTAIAERFGSRVVRPDGELDRDRLRALVLGDERARADLEAIVHPAVQRRRLELESAARERGVPVIVHDIPLLFEALNPGEFDGVILVDAPAELRRERLLRERRISAEEADRLIAIQQPAEAKRAWTGGPRGRGAYVIENEGNLAQLEERVRGVWDEVNRKP